MIKFTSLLFSLIFLACTHRTYIDSQLPEARRKIEHFNSEMEGKNALIIFTDGTTAKATNPQHFESLLMWNDSTGELRKTPVSDITKVTRTIRYRGAGEGFLMGFTAGATFGFIGAVAAGDVPDDSFFFPGTSKYTMGFIAGLVYGGLGGAGGAITGALIGSKEQYFLQPGLTIKDSTRSSD